MAREDDVCAVAISAAAIAIGFSQELPFADYNGVHTALFQLIADVAGESTVAHYAAITDAVPWKAVWANEVDVPLGRRIGRLCIEQGSLPDTATWKAMVAFVVKSAYIPW